MPRRKPNEAFTLVELSVVVAIIGVMAAIAVPSFTRYILKAKTSEAREELNKIYTMAQAYYLETFGASAGGVPIPHQFPMDAPPTPAASCCLGTGQRCDPSSAVWETEPTWVVLNFAIDDPHYFRYSFVSDGVSLTSTFTARANGDLDCDGVESTYEMYGRINSEGEPQGSAAIFRNLPLE